MRIRFVLAAGILSLTAMGQVFKQVPSQGRFELLNEPFSADEITTLVRTLPGRQSHQAADDDRKDVL